MLVWVTAAVALWRHATTEGVPGWHRWLAVAVAMPLIMFIVGHEISKRMDRRR